MDDVIRLRSGGMGWYEAELSPLAVIDREFAKYEEIREALLDDPADESLQCQYQLKARQLHELVGRSLDVLAARQVQIDAQLAQLPEEHPELLEE